MLQLLPNRWWGQVGLNLAKLGFSARFNGWKYSFQSNRTFPSLQILFLLSITMLSTYNTLIYVYFYLSMHAWATTTCPASTTLYPYSMLSAPAAPTVTPNLFWYIQLLHPGTSKRTSMFLYIATRIWAATHQTMSWNRCRLKLSKKKSSEPLSSAGLCYAICKYLHYYGINIKSSSFRKPEQP